MAKSWGTESWGQRMVELEEAFVASGWLGRKVVAGALSWPDDGDDLLPLLLNAADERQAQLLNWSRLNGAKLTVGWPGDSSKRVDSWLGPRLLWWPSGVPEGRQVAWVSSRLGRAIDERPDWFAVLRSAAAKFDSARDVLLTAPSTTVDRFLERAAILFGLRRLRVHLDERRTLVDWLTRLRRQLWQSCLTNDVTTNHDEADQDHTMSDLFVSPMIEAAPTNPKRQRGRTLPDVPNSVTGEAFSLADASGWCDASSKLGELPLSDRMLIAAADQVVALQVRPNGNLHQLLRARLTNSAWPTASVWLALGEAFVPAEVAVELQSLGAVGWWLFVEHVSNVLESQPEAGTLETCPTRLPWPDGDYLVHWTRRRDGPWPGESEADFIDGLLLSRDAISHSAFAALSRIVQQRRLIASAAGIRGDDAVVSFSARPLHELTQQRQFRAHRGRWDCEGYGLCIRRDWLQARGAKPVLYGDDAEWAALSNSDRPFFQLKTTRSRNGAKAIDWSQEAEWRVPHDLDLSEAGRDELVLFAPTHEEAQQLAAISPWPVLVACSDPIYGVERRSTP